MGFEPMTISFQGQCSTNWATEAVQQDKFNFKAVDSLYCHVLAIRYSHEIPGSPLSSHLCPQRTWLWGSHVVPSFSTSSLQFLSLGGRAWEWCHENSSSYTAVRNFWPDGLFASILSHGWCEQLTWGLCKSQLSTWSDSFTTWSTNLFSVTIATHVYTPNITSTTTFIDCWPSQNETLPWSYITVKYSMYLPCSVAQGAGTMGCSHSKYIGNLYRHQTFSYHCWFQLISQKASTLRG